MAKLNKILILNGPNLHYQGKRQTSIYGTDTFDDLKLRLNKFFPHISFEILHTNHEGELINWIYLADESRTPIIINPGALSHYSYALADALAAIHLPVVEVHLSNIFARESWRQQSLTAQNAMGLISGFGIHSYVLAVYALLDSLTD